MWEESIYYMIFLYFDYLDIVLDILYFVIFEFCFNKQDFIILKQIIYVEQGFNSNLISLFGKFIFVLMEMVKVQLFKGIELYCDNLSFFDYL